MKTRRKLYNFQKIRMISEYCIVYFHTGLLLHRALERVFTLIFTILNKSLHREFTYKHGLQNKMLIRLST